MYKDLDLILDEIELNPHSGKHLGTNLYKIRMPISSKGKGKSGGARLIMYVILKNNAVYLAAIYDKPEQSPIDTERLLKALKNLEI